MTEKGWQDSFRNGRYFRRRISEIPTVVHVAPALRTLQSAAAIASAYHKAISSYLKERSESVTDENLTEALRRANIHISKTMQIDGKRTPHGRTITYKDIRGLYLRLRRKGARHVIFVSHTEVLTPLLRNIISLNPESFEAAHQAQLEKENAISEKLGALEKTPELEELNQKMDALTQQENQAREKRDWKEAEKMANEIERLNRVRDEQPWYQEYEDKRHALQKRLEKARKAELRGWKGSLDPLPINGVLEGEHFTFKFTPKSASLIFRGREHPPPLTA